jgi:GT2 family glycosyltransferase
VKISIVIATCGRRGPLERCLAAVARHRTRCELEVITVHAPGDEDAIAMVSASFPSTRVIRSDRRNISYQRNLGAAAASHETLWFLDDDAWPDEGCVDALADAFEADPALGEVGGPALEADGSLQMGPVAVNEFGVTRTVAGPHAVPDGFLFQITGCNMAIRADALHAAGGFDENYAYHLDDSDVSVRIWRVGRRVGWTEKARVFHVRAPGPHRVTIWDRDWRTVAMNQIYFAFRHVSRARWRLAFAPLLHQAVRGAHFFAWALKGRLGPIALARCCGRLVAGVVAGYRKGLTRRPVLPLRRAAAAPHS